MPFDTVDDAREWLQEEGPEADEVREELEEEQETKERTTAVSLFESYLSDVEEEEETEDEEETEEEEETVPDEGGATYRVETSFDEHVVGDQIELDPDDDRTQMLRRDGRIRRW